MRRRRRASKLEEITVTGSRISRADGYEAPTPLTVVGVDVPVGAADMNLFLNLRNVLDSDPRVVAEPPGGFRYSLSAANPVLYDVLGRVYQTGVRFQF